MKNIQTGKKIGTKELKKHRTKELKRHMGMIHKRITIELIEDPKSGGYTVFSEEIDKIVGGGIVSQGDTIEDALHNYANTYHDVIKYKDLKKEKNNEKTC
jgi:hypothetical protein